MKARLELNFTGDGTVYLNFWDSVCGDDVICEVGADGSLTRIEYVDPEGDGISQEEYTEKRTPMTLAEYIAEVRKSSEKDATMG